MPALQRAELGRLATKMREIVETVVQMLRHDDPRVRGAAAEAFGKLSSEVLSQHAETVVQMVARAAVAA